ncbi:MAG: Ig-like domain-containing protein [Desulfomonilia bacterium]|jgi:alpha-tubulin suppressor-like RCC1 family protein|nr:Ig-like domain-containing protein [Deltaproteobacteria bacterium]MDX9760814.1 Ig-like domain-containing protein [Desulfomonilia bacterium]
MRPVRINQYAVFLAIFMIVLVAGLPGCGGGSGNGSGSGEAALAVTSTVPKNGAVDVPTDTIIEIEFSENIQPGTVTLSTIVLLSGSAAVPGEVSCSESHAVYTPVHPLSQSAVYTARVTTGVKGTTGIPLASDYTWEFTTLGQADPSAQSPWDAVAAGGSHVLAIRGDGTLWAWGDNSSGQLGHGTTTSRNVPVQVGRGADWDVVSAGRIASLAIRTNGTLWAWGQGMLGDGLSTRVSALPVQIGSGDDWLYVDIGPMYNFVMALREHGAIWAWGENRSSLLGDPGLIQNSLVPIPIGDDDDWEMLSAGKDHVTAVKADGSLWAWGCNIHGQLGDGKGGDPEDDHQVSLPEQIGTDSDWSFISNGDQYSLAIKTDGSLWAWGHNNYGQLGDGTQTSRNIPVRALDSAGWEIVSAGRDHSAGIRKDGTLFTWGANRHGQLGDGTTTLKTSPVQVGIGKRWMDVATGTYFTLAIEQGGTLWAWGINDVGQLGDGTLEKRLTPVKVQ